MTSKNKGVGPGVPSGSSNVSEVVTFSQSGGLVALLARLNVSLAFTSYQSGFFYLLGRGPNGAHLHQCAIPRPMGLARSGERGIALTTGSQLIRFENPLASHERVNHQFDACYVPRMVHVTGELDAHDVGLDGLERAIFVNTRFNCLARPDPVHSFREVWRPSFISALVDEDRCHLNGLAMRNGSPAFVTACSRSDTIDGWRDRRANGGVVIDVERNAVICEGLSMPHSPRWHNGQLWVLNSGTGELGVVEGFEEGMGTFVPKVFCPGFVRGLAFHDGHAVKGGYTFFEGYAFVGLSKPRYQRFEGLELDSRLEAADSEPWCGIQIIDLARGVCVEWFRIDGAVAELYDVEVLPGVACPMAISPATPEAAGFVTWEGRTQPPSEPDPPPGTPDIAANGALITDEQESAPRALSDKKTGKGRKSPASM